MSKRATCEICQRPLSSCLCDLISMVEHQLEVLFIQHPDEQGHSKGTLPLLTQSLQHNRLLVGEEFESSELQKALFADGKQPILLYPDPAGDASKLTPRQVEPQEYRLIVLDGTWRKTRKLMHLNPLVASLPRLHLDLDSTELELPGYRVRKAHKPGQLSTLEAVYLALTQVEQLDASPLLKAFDTFIERIAARQPKVTPDEQ
ncbi:tRNA-uridine aminocarboxypropyltransferase [Dongshaea marina]|uniref:tRNA-uridine aminocarboxypropyltransferase n=1 Tax=Dongshaea marina TaxID=2047966 RepID=UPI000D3EC08E|nr:tRNA-uridine aminocarboxypropyltransferase [Dongshaea marina]